MFNKMFNDAWVASLAVRFLATHVEKEVFLAWCREQMPDNSNWDREKAMRVIATDFETWVRHASDPRKGF